MCLMLPNMDELLLEQSIFKYLCACYPEPAVTIVTCSGAPLQRHHSCAWGQGFLGAGKADASWAVSQDALWVTLEHPICSVLAAPVQELAEALCRHQAALASLTMEETFLSALPGCPGLALNLNTGSAPIPWERNPLEGATMPARTAFAGLLQGDPACPAKQISSGTCGFWQQVEESLPRSGADWQVLCEPPP